MKKIFKIIGILLALFACVMIAYFIIKNEALPTGKQGKEADVLAEKMLSALHNEAYENAEVLEWSFRNSNFYKWNKQENTVEVSWDKNNVLLDTKNPQNSKIINNAENKDEAKLIKHANFIFNNDSFWLVAPYKVFDKGVERRLVNYNNSDALLTTYTSGGTTPGDSYLWILDDDGLPKSYKMWTSIIPIGGVSATWEDWKDTEAGFKLPTKHKLSIIGMEINLGDVKAYNPKANLLATKILKAVKHEAYKNTRYIEWSFRGARFFKWDKEKHIIDIEWDNNKVILKPNNIEESTAFVDGVALKTDSKALIEKAESIFNNDSFWLVAPHKLFENGIIRTVVTVDGKDALQVKYTTGGSTPGDSYIWILNDDFLPIQFLMTVPSKNMEKTPATWEDWITTESGTLLPKNHTFSNGGKLSMGDVKGYN